MAYIISAEHYLPSDLVRNEDLTEFPKSAIPLIFQKTGIKSRYKCRNDELVSDIAEQAAQKSLKAVSFDPLGLDAVILASSTPDRLIPASAAKIAHKIGALNAFAFDVNSVCSGSIFLLAIAKSLIDSKQASNVLVVASDAYSKILNPKDFSTFPYFGDGAAAALVCAVPPKYCETNIKFKLKIVDSILHTDGSGYDTITLKSGAGEIPPSKVVEGRDCYFSMNGRAVFEFANNKVPKVLGEIMAKRGLDPTEVEKFILHQANINILKNVSSSMGLDFDKFFVNLDRVGNCAGASVLLALSDYLASIDSAKTFMGKHLILCAFGGGLSWGALDLEFII